MKEKQLSYNLLVICKMAYNDLRKLNFQWGIQAEICREYAVKYGIKCDALYEYVSHLKFNYGLNKASFKTEEKYKLFIQLIKDLEIYELEELLSVINNNNKNFDLVKYLSDKKDN